MKQITRIQDNKTPEADNQRNETREDRSEYTGNGEKWASDIWKAYNKGCDHRAYNFAGEHVGGKTHQWEQWSEDERIAYLRGYNGQHINSERQR